MRKSLIGWVLSSLVGLTLFVGCDPVPRRQLTSEEKIADLYWVYSQFGENYAPLEYKQQRLGFNYETLKLETVEKAKLTKNNDEFYSLLFNFVSTFQDAHTSGALTNSSLPNRASVAYLGFSGERSGDNLIVKKFLPTIDKDGYPVKEGDEILKLNGKTLKSIIDSDLKGFRNLGNVEANYTYHMNKIFTRVSTQNGQPTGSDAILTVKRDDKEIEITVPWIVKDLYKFQKDQTEAEKAKKSESTDPAELDENYVMTADGSNNPLFRFRILGFNGRPEFPFSTWVSISRQFRKTFLNSFKIVDLFASWEAATGEKEAPLTPMQTLKKVRSVPSSAIEISSAQTYPAYVSVEKVRTKAGDDSGKKALVGTIYLDTFSPAEDEEEVIKQFKATLKDFNTLGVKTIVIDLINNGGGSLSLGAKLAQALFPTTIEMPKIQFRLSDTWLDEFESTILNSGAGDLKRELARRTLNGMIEDQAAGKKLSRPLSIETLFPYELEKNEDYSENPQVILLVNEMCASMCDIFSAMLQDNGVAKIVGTQTMGAGGNVVGHNQAPNSHFDVRQTESLLLRKDGTYIENNGVMPDVEIAVNESAGSKYSAVRKKALEKLLVE